MQIEESKNNRKEFTFFILHDNPKKTELFGITEQSKNRIVKKYQFITCYNNP